MAQYRKLGARGHHDRAYLRRGDRRFGKRQANRLIRRDGGIALRAASWRPMLEVRPDVPAGRGSHSW